MIGKILFTSLIIFLVYLVIRNRGQGIAATRTRPAESAARAVAPRLAAYVFLGVAMVTGSVVYYLEWLEDRQVVTIRVINSRTQEVVTYQAHRGKIRGRRFETLDGREVSVAEMERLEMFEEE